MDDNYGRPTVLSDGFQTRARKRKRIAYNANIETARDNHWRYQMNAKQLKDLEFIKEVENICGERKPHLREALYLDVMNGRNLK